MLGGMNKSMRSDMKGRLAISDIEVSIKIPYNPGMGKTDFPIRM
jgi:hypothetical protein